MNGISMSKDWEVQSAMNTLKEADKIKKNPKLMQQVSKMAAQEVNSLQKLTNNKEKSMAKQPKRQIDKQSKVTASKMAKKEMKPVLKKLGKRGK